MIKKTIGKILYNAIGIHMPRSYAKFHCNSRKFRQFCAKLILGDRCAEWVNIEKGAKFGDGCVIGTGAIVTKNIPDYEVWAGNPAHKLYSRKDIKKG